MNCVDSKVSFVNTYIWHVYVPLEMKEARTGAIILRISYILLSGVRYVHCVTDEK